MELTPYVTSLREALAAAGNAAADNVREAADRLSCAIEPSLRLTLIEALSDAAAEITTQLSDVSVDVRMRGGNPDFVTTDNRMAEPPEPPPAPEPPQPGAPDQPVARISLRLPESLKVRAEQAAAAEGISVNAWIARAISYTLDGPGPGIHVSPQTGVHINMGRSSRHTGWAR